MHAREVINKLDNRRTAFYGRYSTGKQDIKMQLDTVDRFCAQYDLVTPPEELQFHDDGVSATKVPMQRRQKLMYLLDAVEQQKVDVILAYSDSRLARDPVEHAQLRLAFGDIPVILCNSETVYNPQRNELLSQTIMDAASKYEVDQTAERTRDMFKWKIKNGEHIGGQMPYGYRCIESKAKPTEVNVVERSDTTQNSPKTIKKFIAPLVYEKQIKEVYRRYARGEGFSSIAKAMGWYQHEDPTKPPYKERVKSIIINPFYAGRVSMYKVKPNSRLSVRDFDEWQYEESKYIVPVITWEEWLRCFKIYQSKQQKRIAPRQYKTSFLLRGLIECCGQPMKCKNNTKQKKDHKGRVIRTYGSRNYICPVCRRKVDAVALHHEVLERFIRGTLARDEKDLRTAVIQELLEEKEDHENEVGQIEESVTLQRKQIEAAKEALKPLLEQEDPPKAALRILEDYGLVLQQRIANQTKWEKRVKTRLTVLNDILEKDDDLVSSLQFDLINEASLRNLLLHMIVKITIGDENRLQIESIIGKL